MKSNLFIFAFLAAASSASVLSTTNIATTLAGATDQSALTIPADAMAAIAKLGTGGATASTLSAADKAAITSCATTADANNTASKAGLGGGTGSAGNIAFVTNKVTIHACEAAGQQVTGTGSDTAISLLISNVGVLNANTAKAAKREVAFKA